MPETKVNQKALAPIEGESLFTPRSDNMLENLQVPKGTPAFMLKRLENEYRDAVREKFAFEFAGSLGVQIEQLENIDCKISDFTNPSKNKTDESTRYTRAVCSNGQVIEVVDHPDLKRVTCFLTPLDMSRTDQIGCVEFYVP